MSERIPQKLGKVIQIDEQHLPVTDSAEAAAGTA